MKRKKRYNRKEQALLGAKRSYRMRQKKDYELKYISEEEYIEEYLAKKEYEQYKKILKQNKKGIIRKELTYEEFKKDVLEMADEAHIDRFDIGRNIGRESVFKTEGELRVLKKESGIDLRDVKNTMELHNLITYGIDTNMFTKEEIEDVLY